MQGLALQSVKLGGMACVVQAKKQAEDWRTLALRGVRRLPADPSAVAALWVDISKLSAITRLGSTGLGRQMRFRQCQATSAVSRPSYTNVSRRVAAYHLGLPSLQCSKSLPPLGLPQGSGQSRPRREAKVPLGALDIPQLCCACVCASPMSGVAF